MSIKVEHNGYEITYSENQDVWRCWPLDLEAAKLSTLRTKINKVDAERRRLKKLTVWYVGYGTRPELKDATLVEMDGVWLLDRNADKGKVTRRKAKLEHVVLDTPENRVLIEKLIAAEIASAEASRHVRQLREALPTPKMGELMALGANEETEDDAA